LHRAEVIRRNATTSDQSKAELALDNGCWEIPHSRSSFWFSLASAILFGRQRTTHAIATAAEADLIFSHDPLLDSQRGI